MERQITWLNANGNDDFHAAAAMGVCQSQIWFLRHQLHTEGLKLESCGMFRRTLVSSCIYTLTPHHICIHYFGTHHDHRRQGNGRVLMERMQSKLSRNSRTTLLVNVPEEWLGGQLFLRSLGFRASLPIAHDPCRGPCYQFRFTV